MGAMQKHPLLVSLAIALLILMFLAAGVLALSRPQGGSWLPGKGTSFFFGRGKIGVVVVAGTIIDATDTIKALDQFRRESDIKAVLLRVESPGGGLAPSQEIFREILRTKKAKPVVCSLGGVAASGGYYVASACSKIMANPGTITGSIGVIATLPNLKGLFDKLGIKMQVVKAGKYKATGQIDRPLSEGERAMLQGVIKEAHEQFIADVAKSRRLPVEKVRALATGGIFTGRRALKLGLVDRLGNFHDAVLWAAKLGGVRGRPQLVYPPRRGVGWLRELLRGGLRMLLSELLRDAEQGRIEYRWHLGRSSSTR